MKHLSLFARITTPAAMVVFLSYEMSRALSVSGWWYALLLVGSFASALGIEFVGLLAGRTLEGYWRLGDTGRSFLSFALLLIYTFAAVYVLRGNPVLVVVPILAAIVYILAALSDGLDAATTKKEEVTAVRMEYGLEKQRANDEHKRRMEAAEMRLKHEERMERLKVCAIPAPQPIAEPQATPQPTTPYECSCGRVFAKSQSYSAHTRHCEVHRQIASNGQVKHG